MRDNQTKPLRTPSDDARFRAFLRLLLDLPPYARAEALHFYHAYHAVDEALRPAA